MQRFYLNQTKVSISLDTQEPLTNCTAKLKYRKPDETLVEKSAQISGTKVTYEFASSESMDQLGFWSFWAVVTFPDTRVAPTEPVKVQVVDQGT